MEQVGYVSIFGTYYLNTMLQINYRFLFIAAMLSTTFSTRAQVKQKAFTLTGKINLASGTIRIVPSGDPLLFPVTFKNDEVNIINGQFVFEGWLAYACPFTLRTVNGDYGTAKFFIEPGRQSIICNANSIREMPALNNKIMSEYKNGFSKGQSGKISRDKYIATYAADHPNSEIALWAIADRLDVGYSTELDSAYSKLDTRLRNNFTGNIVAKKLAGSRLVSIGMVFPSSKFSDSNQIIRKILVTDKLAKFTLVDFWFSHCASCISEFPKLKTLYAKYGRDSFEILGISIDDTKNVQSWKDVMIAKQLPWPQYLDENGVIANGFAIASYPTNFLLDQSGKIIARDLWPRDLEAFLEKNIHQ